MNKTPKLSREQLSSVLKLINDKVNTTAGELVTMCTEKRVECLTYPTHFQHNTDGDIGFATVECEVTYVDSGEKICFTCVVIVMDFFKPDIAPAVAIHFPAYLVLLLIESLRSEIGNVSNKQQPPNVFGKMGDKVSPS